MPKLGVRVQWCGITTQSTWNLTADDISAPVALLVHPAKGPWTTTSQVSYTERRQKARKYTNALNAGTAPAIHFSDRRNDSSADLYVLPPKEAVEHLRRKEDPKPSAPSSSSSSESEAEDSSVRRRVKSRVNLVKDLDCSSFSDDSGLDTPDCIILDDDDDDEAVVPLSKVQNLDSDQDPLPGPSTGGTDQAQVPPAHGVPQEAAPSKAAEDKPSHRKGSERAMATGSAPGQDPTWALVLHRGRIAQLRLPSCSQGTKLRRNL